MTAAERETGVVAAPRCNCPCHTGMATHVAPCECEWETGFNAGPPRQVPITDPKLLAAQQRDNEAIKALRGVADGAADPTTKEKSMSLPHAGYFVKVTRPDGVTYEAMLQRYDGPHGALAVLYSQPADCPPGEELYEHTVKVAPLGLTEQPERLWRLELLDTPANREALVRRNVLALADEADRLAEDGHGWVTTSALRAVLGG